MLYGCIQLRAAAPPYDGLCTIGRWISFFSCPLRWSPCGAVASNTSFAYTVVCASQDGQLQYFGRYRRGIPLNDSDLHTHLATEERCAASRASLGVCSS